MCSESRYRNKKCLKREYNEALLKQYTFFFLPLPTSHNPIIIIIALGKIIRALGSRDRIKENK